MVNLNTTDVNELVLKLSNALFNVLDCEAMRDIECAVECSEDDLENIFQMRKIAREIAFEKKFIPLDFNPKDDVQLLDDSGGEWYTNTGEEPMFEGRNVDVMWFDSDGAIDYNKPIKHWDWTIGTGNNSTDIQFWRYSK